MVDWTSASASDSCEQEPPADAPQLLSTCSGVAGGGGEGGGGDGGGGVGGGDGGGGSGGGDGGGGEGEEIGLYLQKTRTSII